MRKIIEGEARETARRTIITSWMLEEENHFSSISGKFRQKWRVRSKDFSSAGSTCEIKKGGKRKNMWHFIKRSIFTAIPIPGLRGDRGTVEYSPFFLPLFLQLETIIKHRVLTRDPCGNLSFLFLSPHPLLPVEQEIYFRSALDPFRIIRVSI